MIRQLTALATGLCLAITLTARAQSVPLLLGPYVLGSSVYSTREFSTAIAATVGKPVSASSLDTLRTAIQARYVRDGYISPIIEIPQADLGSPTPRLYVYEARIEDIVLKGDPGPYRARIEHYLTALRSGPLRKASVRQVLLQIRQLPGLTSRPVFDPSPEVPNAFHLVVGLDYAPADGEIDVNNGGTRDLGRVIYAGLLSLNGLLGTGERLQLEAASSSQPDQYQYANLKAAGWLGAFTEGFIEATGVAAVPDPDDHFSDRNVILGLSHSLFSRGYDSLVLTVSVHGDNSEIHGAQNTRFVSDRIRAGALNLQFEHAGPLAQTSTFVTLEHAARILGATSLDTQDSEIRVAFTKYLFGVTQSIALNPLWRARFGVYAQVTPDVLPIVERYAFGGLGYGEAFDPASLVGDSGTTVTAELGRAVALHLAQIRYATVFARTEWGIAWNNASYLPAKDEAASASVGMLGKWTHFTGTLELSTPVIQPDYSPRTSSARALLSGAYVF